MEFEDILKIVAFIAIFVVQSLFGSKKKKQKKEEERKRQALQAELEQYSETSDPTPSTVESTDFFDEVKRMLDEPEKKTSFENGITEVDFSASEEAHAGVTVEDDYFEKKHKESEAMFFTEMPKASEEAKAQLTETKEVLSHDKVITNTTTEKTNAITPRVKGKINLRQAIIHKVILERKYK